jgi:hypothetical protein
MMPAGEIDPVRLQIANVLDAWGSEPGWNDDLWTQFNELLKLTEVDGLLAHAHEELTHYSGQFSARNLLGFRVKPDKIQVAVHKEDFLMIAAAIRGGMTWDEFKRQNNIFEGGKPLSAVASSIKKRLSR